MSAIIQRPVFFSNRASVSAITKMMDCCVSSERKSGIAMRSPKEVEQYLWAQGCRVLEMIGKGTYGAVLKCEQIATQKLYAVKVATNIGRGDTLSMEAENLKKLNGLAPAYTVKCVDLFMLPFDATDQVSRTGLLTEYGGVDLRKRYVEGKERISIFDIGHIIAQLVCVGEILEKERLVLRDMKPANIIVGANPQQKGSVKVIDTDTLGELGVEADWLETTLYYRSPTLLKQKYDHSEFPFAIGCILYELLTRIPLFGIKWKSNQETDSNKMKRHLHAVSVVHPLEQTFIEQLPKEMQDEFFQKNENGMFEIASTNYLKNEEKASRYELKKLISNSLRDKITLSEGHTHKNVVRRSWKFIKHCVNYSNPPSTQNMRESSFFGPRLFQQELAFHRASAS